MQTSRILSCSSLELQVSITCCLLQLMFRGGKQERLKQACLLCVVEELNSPTEGRS